MTSTTTAPHALDEHTLWQLYIRQNIDTPARVIDGEAVVVTPHDSTIHQINEAGTFIWEKADGTKKLDEILQLFLIEYNVPSLIEVKQDFLDFTQDAVQKSLLLTSIEASPVSLF